MNGVMVQFHWNPFLHAIWCCSNKTKQILLCSIFEPSTCPDCLFIFIFGKKQHLLSFCGDSSIGVIKFLLNEYQLYTSCRSHGNSSCLQGALLSVLMLTGSQYEIYIKSVNKQVKLRKDNPLTKQHRLIDICSPPFLKLFMRYCVGCLILKQITRDYRILMDIQCGIQGSSSVVGSCYPVPGTIEIRKNNSLRYLVPMESSDQVCYFSAVI